MLGGSEKEWDAGELGKAIEKCGAAGVDFIAMKGCSGGYMKDEKGNETYQAALKWILHNPYMKTTATAMGNFQEIEEDIGAMGGGGLGQAEWQLLDRYASLYGKNFCRMCGNCTGQCPAGVKVAEVNRLHMYAASYGENMKQQAHRSYSALGAGNAAACQSCETCTVHCAYGLPLVRKLKEAHALLS
jgi:predicted aldo/keto reductase-like oxidoreductase